MASDDLLQLSFIKHIQQWAEHRPLWHAEQSLRQLPWLEAASWQKIAVPVLVLTLPIVGCLGLPWSHTICLSFVSCFLPWSCLSLSVFVSHCSLSVMLWYVQWSLLATRQRVPALFFVCAWTMWSFVALNASKCNHLILMARNSCVTELN